MSEDCICAAEPGEPHLSVCPKFVGRPGATYYPGHRGEHERAVAEAKKHATTFKADPAVLVLLVDKMLAKVAEQRLMLRKLRALALLAEQPVEPKKVPHA